MRLLLQIITTLVIVAYPLAVYFGLQYLPPGYIALLLCVLLLTRMIVTKQQVRAMVLPLVVGIALTGASFIAKRNDWLLYYPLVINLSLLSLFSYSLMRGPSMIERLARVQEPNLPDSAIDYLRTVTKLWCGLFVVNAAMAAYTAIATTIETWTLYNGLIAYVLIGMLLSGEWIYRKFWLKKHD